MGRSVCSTSARIGLQELRQSAHRVSLGRRGPDLLEAGVGIEPASFAGRRSGHVMAAEPLPSLLPLHRYVRYCIPEGGGRGASSSEQIEPRLTYCLSVSTTISGKMIRYAPSMRLSRSWTLRRTGSMVPIPLSLGDRRTTQPFFAGSTSMAIRTAERPIGDWSAKLSARSS